MSNGYFLVRGRAWFPPPHSAFWSGDGGPSPLWGWDTGCSSPLFPGSCLSYQRWNCFKSSTSVTVRTRLRVGCWEFPPCEEPGGERAGEELKMRATEGEREREGACRHWAASLSLSIFPSALLPPQSAYNTPPLTTHSPSPATGRQPIRGPRRLWRQGAVGFHESQSRHVTEPPKERVCRTDSNQAGQRQASQVRAAMTEGKQEMTEPAGRSTKPRGNVVRADELVTQYLKKKKEGQTSAVTDSTGK